MPARDEDRRWTHAAEVRALLVLLGALFLLLLAANLFLVRVNQQFVFLGDSFLHGHLDFQPQHTPFLAHDTAEGVIWHDVSEWQGRKYWPLGPVPALLMTPFVAVFGTGFLQGFLSFPLSLLNFVLLFRIARALGNEPRSSLYLATAFVFGSVYVGVAAYPLSWFFAQVVATSFVLLALHELLVRQDPRWWLAGLYIGLAGGCRGSLLLIVLFAGFLLWRETERRKAKALQLAAPIAVVVVLLMAYNAARFGSPLESGYALQNVSSLHAIARSEGLFSLRHVPGNVFAMFFSAPEAVVEPGSSVLRYPYLVASPWSLSLLFVAPVFGFVLLAPRREWLVKSAVLTSLIMVVPIVTYYGTGASQFGYRYALDFFPLLYLVLCRAFAPSMPVPVRWLTMASVLFNAYLLWHFRF